MDQSQTKNGLAAQTLPVQINAMLPAACRQVLQEKKQGICFNFFTYAFWSLWFSRIQQETP